MGPRFGTDAPAAAWRPSAEYLERSRLRRFLTDVGCASLEELQARAEADPAWFWSAAVADIGIRFDPEPRTVLDVSRGPEWARWWVDAGFNWVRAGVDEPAGEDGEALVWEGEESLLVANVIEGVLKLSTSTGDGREQIVGIVYPSDFIGRPFGEHSHHSVTALTDAKVCLFTRRQFDTFARQHPEVGHELLRRTLRELDRARNFMLLLGRKTAAEKVASLLLDMASRLSDNEGRFALPIGRQQMADLLGLTIETVSRQLSRMRAVKVIETEGRRGMIVRDPNALAAAAAI